MFFFSDWRVGQIRPPGQIWAISVVRNIFEKIGKGVKSGQKVFTACRRGLKVCGREINISRLVIDQLRWEAVDRHDLTPPTHFLRISNFRFQGSFHCITCVVGESASTLIAQNYTYFVPYMGQYFLPGGLIWSTLQSEKKKTFWGQKKRLIPYFQAP